VTLLTGRGKVGKASSSLFRSSCGDERGENEEDGAELHFDFSISLIWLCRMMSSSLLVRELSASYNPTHRHPSTAQNFTVLVSDA
jgi:hypothetical protein